MIFSKITSLINKLKIKSQLRKLNISKEEINDILKSYKTSVLPFKGFPSPKYFAWYRDFERYGEGYYCYCPKCNSISLTNRSACMCGSCLTCGYRWICTPVPLDFDMQNRHKVDKVIGFSWYE